MLTGDGSGEGRATAGTPRPRSLAEIRAAYSACRSDTELDAIAFVLAEDERAGARELLSRIESKRATARREPSWWEPSSNWS